MDRISELPDSVIEKILSSLPLLDAVKTGVLAKAWRHKWVRLRKLVFDENFWRKCSCWRKSEDSEEDGEEGEMYRNLNLLSAILLQHIGVLDELYLDLLEIPSAAKCEHIIPSIQFALRKGVKTLCLKHCPIPAFVYSCTQLTSLEILPTYEQTCSLPTSFEGLPNLVSLWIASFHDDGEGERLVHFISKCPKIKKVSLFIRTVKNLQFRAPSLEDLSIRGEFARFCFPDVKNLKKLFIQFGSVAHPTSLAMKRQRMNIFSGLVKLESLILRFDTLKLLASSGVPKRATGCLQNLKAIDAEELIVHGLDELRFLLCLLASSPNLHQFDMFFVRDHGLYDEEEMEIDSYRDHKFKKLHSVYVYTKGDEFDIKMMELLLYCSPNLELMDICYDYDDEDMDMRMPSDLLELVSGFTCASAKANISVWIALPE